MLFVCLCSVSVNQSERKNRSYPSHRAALFTFTKAVTSSQSRALFERQQSRCLLTSAQRGLTAGPDWSTPAPSDWPRPLEREPGKRVKKGKQTNKAAKKREKKRLSWAERSSSCLQAVLGPPLSGRATRHGRGSPPEPGRLEAGHHPTAAATGPDPTCHVPGCHPILYDTTRK